MSQAQESLACWPDWTTNGPAVAPSGTRAITRASDPMMMGAPISPMVTRGCADLATPFPRICNSPPAIAAGGVTWEICGLESDDFRTGMLIQIETSGCE